MMDECVEKELNKYGILSFIKETIKDSQILINVADCDIEYVLENKHIVSFYSGDYSIAKDQIITVTDDMPVQAIALFCGRNLCLKDVDDSLNQIKSIYSSNLDIIFGTYDCDLTGTMFFTAASNDNKYNVINDKALFKNNLVVKKLEEIKATGPDTTVKSQSISLYAVAKAVIEHNEASISFIQKEFNMGFNSAARMMCELEKLGVVSEKKENGRVVLLTLEDLQKKIF